MSSTENLFVRKSSGLTRDISAWDALIFNVVVMCPQTAYIYGVWAAGFYPGVNLPLAVLMSVPVVIVIGLFYALYNAAMPRTGGDYVWASRVLHPAIGFSIVFFVFFILLAWIGTLPVWLVNYSIGPVLTYFGSTGLASALSSPMGLFAFGLVLFLLYAAVIGSGTKTFVKALWLASALQIMGNVLYIAVLLYTGPDMFKTNFNTLSGMNYDTVISAAQAAGYPSGFTTEGTFLGIVYTMLSFTGFNLSVYISGEIKEVRRSQIIAILGGTVAFAFWLFTIYQVTYSVMGAQFVNAISFLSVTANPAYTLPFTPTFYNLLFIYASNNNVWITALVNLGYCFGLTSTLTYAFTCVRMVFSWSFDRILPKSFASIDRRFNSPYIAIIVVIILSIVSLGLWLFTPFMSYFAYVVPGWFIQIAIVAASGVVFPFRRKSIFESSPPIVTKKVAGIPLISLLGLITIALSGWLIYAGFMPAIAGTINPTYVLFTFGVYFIGLVIYVISSVYRRRSGLPLEMTFGEVPPE